MAASIVKSIFTDCPQASSQTAHKRSTDDEQVYYMALFESRPYSLSFFSAGRAISYSTLLENISLHRPHPNWLYNYVWKDNST